MRRLTQEDILDRVTVEPNTGCWLWLLGLNQGGYGRYRLAFHLFRGQQPAGMDLDHLCRVRSCVNPWHLEPVTRSQNLLRGNTGRWSRGSFCRAGHELTPENTAARPDRPGARGCRECRRAADRRWRKRNV